MQIITRERVRITFHKETYTDMLYCVLTIAAFSATESRLGKLAKRALREQKAKNKMKTGAKCYSSLMKYSPLGDFPNLKI